MSEHTAASDQPAGATAEDVERGEKIRFLMRALGLPYEKLAGLRHHDLRYGEWLIEKAAKLAHEVSGDLYDPAEMAALLADPGKAHALWRVYVALYGALRIGDVEALKKAKEAARVFGDAGAVAVALAAEHVAVDPKSPAIIVEGGQLTKEADEKLRAWFSDAAKHRDFFGIPVLEALPDVADSLSPSRPQEVRVSVVDLGAGGLWSERRLIARIREILGIEEATPAAGELRNGEQA